MAISSVASTDPKVRVRFAPSPTGSLHVGSARTALFNFLFSRHNGGTFVLRVEDTDEVRSDEAHESAILDDLRWLVTGRVQGPSAWDEGPQPAGSGSAEGGFGPYRQSQRGHLYRRAAERLLSSSKAYRCFCSTERLEQLKRERLAAGLMPKYDGRCAAMPFEQAAERIAAGEQATVRLRVPPADIVVDDLVRGRVTFSPDVIGDFVLLRSSGAATYNFAAALDDHLMAITHVIRGDDHLTNTARQLLVLAALDAPAPSYAHLSLILGPDGAKLSKRHGATSVAELRDAGYMPEAVRNYLALLSWSHEGREILSLDELIAAFDLDHIMTSPVTFDAQKLDWLGHQWIMRRPFGQHVDEVRSRLPADADETTVWAIAMAAQPSISRYGQIPEFAGQILQQPVLGERDAAAVASACGLLQHFRDVWAALPPEVPGPAAEEALARYRRFGATRGLKAAKILMPLRLALTGTAHGPELKYVLGALHRDEALARVDCALARALGPPTTTSPDKGDHQ